MCLALQECNLRLGKVLRGDYKNRNAAQRRILLYPAQNLEAIHFWHRQVQQDRIHMNFGEKSESFFATVREMGSVTARAQDVADEIKCFTIIVHYKDVIRPSSLWPHVLTNRLQKSRFLDWFHQILCRAQSEPHLFLINY